MQYISSAGDAASSLYIEQKSEREGICGMALSKRDHKAQIDKKEQVKYYNGESQADLYEKRELWRLRRVFRIC